ncbi:MAG: DEAD/DEAH box helicase [Streptosporangiales bacterium]|nr:DEAD/DEAH box helicase [Streptosporangiales bacterium]MBO0890557.1 DEAD/DEAH box helicase [Acidothermales bacterium]
MTSPAQRYAAAQRRAAEARTELGRFRDLYDFRLDPFQVEACRSLEAGSGVLVAAPTGAGKTVVGEFAVHLALATGTKCFYTTPIKALSNQKYADLVRRYDARTVGLLTGDNSINGDAPVVVMTTEVLRNMLYAGSETLRGLSHVVMDEVHYLSDRFRGAVWEECIIHLPESVRLVALSATVSNAEEFGDWLQAVRGDTDVVVEETRPVPLWQHVLAGNRLYDLFVDMSGKKVNPELVRLARDDARNARWERRGGGRGYGRGRGPRGRRTFRPPARTQVVERLDRDGLLPAIYFVFSRAGCDAAVLSCLYGGIRLNTPDEAAEVRAYADQRCSDIPDDDLRVLGFDEWRESLTRGVAAHHAGMLPTFKEVTEELFARGLIKVVFATETLALGVNMPARSVLLESLTKWNGETHADITAGEYTQLTGRAGRRGIDVEGHGVVLFTPELDPEALGGLASTRTYPLRSSFRPSYNMAVNLVRQVGRDRARGMLEESFAQFQADRAVVGLARRVSRNEEALRGYRDAMTCHLGDFEEYAELRRRLSDLEARQARDKAAKRRAAAIDSLGELRRGDVIVVPAGRRSGLAVVLDPGLSSGRDDPHPVVLTSERQVRRLGAVDFPTPVEPLGNVRIPKSFNGRSPQHRRDLVSTLHAQGYDDKEARRASRRRGAGPHDPEIDRLRARLRAHPCHGCADREDHARWAERYFRLLKETEGLQRRVEGRTNLIARTFDRVCGVLDTLGYLVGEDVTADGERLGRLYTEMDLLTSECLRQGLWDGLRPAELAACVSTLVYEARQSDDTTSPRLPRGAARETLGEMVRLWGQLEEVESENGVSFQREPDLGFCWATLRWATGARLETVLADSDMAPGDFVRWTKQVVDLLGQVADATRGDDGSVHGAARGAIDAMHRGVVAYTSVA